MVTLKFLMSSGNFGSESTSKLKLDHEGTVITYSRGGRCKWMGGGDKNFRASKLSAGQKFQDLKRDKDVVHWFWVGQILSARDFRICTNPTAVNNDSKDRSLIIAVY